MTLIKKLVNKIPDEYFGGIMTFGIVTTFVAGFHLGYEIKTSQVQLENNSRNYSISQPTRNVHNSDESSNILIRECKGYKAIMNSLTGHTINLYDFDNNDSYDLRTDYYREKGEVVYMHSFMKESYWKKFGIPSRRQFVTLVPDTTILESIVAEN